MSDFLITGMPGSGKSAVLGALAQRGFQIVETDNADYCRWVRSATGEPIVDGVPGEEVEWVWDEQRIAALLDSPCDGSRFIGGVASNQGRFYARFERVFLLQAPARVLRARLHARRGNDYGKHPAELQAVLSFAPVFAQIMLHAGASPVDASLPLSAVVNIILARSEQRLRAPGAR